MSSTDVERVAHHAGSDEIAADFSAQLFPGYTGLMDGGSDASDDLGLPAAAGHQQDRPSDNDRPINNGGDDQRNNSF